MDVLEMVLNVKMQVKWYYKLIEDKIVSEYFSDHVEALSAASAIADFDEEE